MSKRTAVETEDRGSSNFESFPEIPRIKLKSKRKFPVNEVLRF